VLQDGGEKRTHPQMSQMDADGGEDKGQKDKKGESKRNDPQMKKMNADEEGEQRGKGAKGRIEEE
jgi:hypothetical protein